VTAQGIQLTDTLRWRLAHALAQKPDAHLLYLQGLYFLDQPGPASTTLANAEKCFGKAIELDPDYAPAYVGVAMCFRPQVIPPSEYVAVTSEWCKKALDRDPNLPEALIGLASIKLAFEWDWAQADEYFRKAIQANPNSALARDVYGLYFLTFRRFDEALRTRLEAERLDPLASGLKLEVGDVYYFQRRFTEATRYYREALRLEPADGGVYRALGRVSTQLKRHGEAISQCQRAVDLSPGNTRCLASLGHAYAMAGRPREALNVLRQLENRPYVSPYDLAKVRAGLGQDAQALDLLEQAVTGHHRGPATMQVDLEFEPLRNHPRFLALLTKMGLRDPRSAAREPR
jgi:tetratricopeptide (TPR) repeat protein